MTLHANETKRRAVLIPASTVKRERVEWLWPGRVPLGMLTLLAGDPGLGKSLLTVSLAARVTRGELCGPGAVIMATAEDSRGATVRPRLEAAGADLDRVTFLTICDEAGEDGFRLPDDTGELEAAVSEEAARLVVIDPLMAHLSERVNSWHDQSIRLALAPLRTVAERQGCAVLVVAHLNKSLSADVLRRIGASVGLQGAARSTLLLARHPDDAEAGRRRVLAHVKCNVGPEQPSLAFEVEPVLIPARDGDPEIETARIVERGTSSYTKDDLLGRESTTRMKDAQAFLTDSLADGPRPSADVKAQARAEGITDITLRRAREALGVEDVREGFPSRTCWRLPSSRDHHDATDGDDPDDHDCGNLLLEPNPSENGSSRARISETITTERERAVMAELDALQAEGIGEWR